MSLTVSLFTQAIAHDAFRALVNLSDSSIMVSALSDASFLQFLVSYILVGADFYSSGVDIGEAYHPLSESAIDPG